MQSVVPSHRFLVAQERQSLVVKGKAIAEDMLSSLAVEAQVPRSCVRHALRKE